MKGKVLGVLAAVFACMLLALPFAAAVPEEESTVPVLMDNGDGSTEWGEAPVSGTVSDVIEAAFPGTVFSWTEGITVDGTGSVTTGGADSGGSYTEPGATGNSTTASWKVYSWNGSAWEETSPSSACTGPVAIGLYPDGFVPTETPDHRTSWTMIRGDSSQTGAADAVFSSTEPSSVKWTDRGSAYAAMLHAGGYVFVKYGCGTDLRASVVCYKLETGDKVWEFTYPGISNYETGTPVIVGDMIYIPSALGYVFSFDWRDGPGTLDASAGTYSGEVMMTNATGSPRAYSDGDVDQRVGAIPNSTATLEGTTYNAGNTSIVYDRGALFFSNTNGMVYCLDTSLNLIWSYQTGGSIYFTTPTVYKDTVFVGALDGRLYALDRTDGSEIDSALVYQNDRNGKKYGSVASVSVVEDGGRAVLMFSVSEGRGMNTTTGGYAVYSFDGSSLSEVATVTDGVGLTGNFFAASQRNGSPGAYFLSTNGLYWLNTDGTAELLNGGLALTKAPPVTVNGEYVYVASYAPGNPMYRMDADGKILSTIRGTTTLYNYCMSQPLVIGDWVIWANDSGVAAYYGEFEAYSAPAEPAGIDLMWVVLAVIAAIIVLLIAMAILEKRRGEGILTRTCSRVASYASGDSLSHNTRSRHRLLIMVSVGALLSLIMAIACLCIGPSGTYSPGEALSALFSAVSKGGQNLTVEEIDVYSSRLPRTVMALVVGIGLSVAGVMYQAVIRNPLVDPYIMGVSAGAGTAAVAVLSFNFTFFGLLTGSVYTTAIAAMVGGLFAFGVTMLIAEKAGGTSINYVLAGVVVGLVFSAIQSLILTMGSENVSGSLTWLFGSFSSVDWNEVAIVLFPALAMSLVPLIWAKEFNLILLGEDQARQMGLNVRRFNRGVLVLASVLASLCVAFVGIIGFVGLVVPHLCRMVLGGDHRLVLPSSIAFGGFLMMAADLASRMLLAGIELPVGAITTLIGVPVFAWLLIRKGRMYDG